MKVGGSGWGRQGEEGRSLELLKALNHPQHHQATGLLWCALNAVQCPLGLQSAVGPQRLSPVAARGVRGVAGRAVELPLPMAL